jgi:hypothetical protein
MKFLCITEFVHSGKKIYSAGVTYDLTKEGTNALLELDKKKPLGALSFFKPVDEEAVEFIKSLNGKTETKTDKPDGKTETKKEV